MSDLDATDQWRGAGPDDLFPAVCHYVWACPSACDAGFFGDLLICPVRLVPSFSPLSCSYASVAARRRSDWASSPSLFPCPCHCSLHFHDHGHADAHLPDPFSRSHQLSAPCSDQAHHRYRYHSKNLNRSSRSRSRQVREVCGRYSTPCYSSCPCPRYPPRPLPIEYAFVLEVLLASGECRWGWVCWGRRRFGGLFGCRVFQWVLLCPSLVGGCADVVTFCLTTAVLRWQCLCG